MIRRGVLLALAGCLLAPAAASAQGALAFVSNRCDDGGVPWTGSWFGPGEKPCTPGIFVMNDDGTDERRLTKGFSEGSDEPRSGDGAPSWSPTGDRIVFDRQTSEGFGYVRLFVMNADGTGQRRLIPDGVPGAAYEQTPSWSRLGDLIAFHAVIPAENDFGSIHVVRPDGTGLRRVSPRGQTAYNPTFAPDGVHIVYSGTSCRRTRPRTTGSGSRTASGPRRGG